MATGGFLPNESAPSNQATSQIMTKENDLQMRLIYLTRRTCDQLSRDLTKHAIAENYDSNWDDWLKEFPDRLEKCKKKYFKRYFGDGTPALHQCDTTTLTEMLLKEIIHGGIKTYDLYLEKLKNFRNKVSHNELETGISESEFQEELKILNQFLLELLSDSQSQIIFPSVQSCLQFLSQNRKMTLAQFCDYYPNEITIFMRSLEPHLRKILMNIRCLPEEVSQLDHRLENVETKQDFLESKLELKQQESMQLPSSSLRPFSISGRESEVESLKTSLVNSQLALIHGPPGIGKTSLANNFGQKLTSENQVCVEIQFGNFAVPSGELCDQHIARKIGRGITGIPEGLEETEDPLSLLARHVRNVVKDRKLLLIFDNIDPVLNSETAKRDLQTVTGELVKAGKGLQIIFTARCRKIDTDPYHCEIIKLDPLSQNDLKLWISEKESKMPKEFLKEITICSGGIPFILNILFNYANLHEDFKIDEFEEIKTSPIWNKLNYSLKLSFNRLEDELLLTMLYASAFNGNFDSDTLAEMYIKTNPSDFRRTKMLVRECRDLSLCEYDTKSGKYFLHPYLQEYICDTYAGRIKQKSVDSIFVQVYFEKLLSKARQQLEERDNFYSVIVSLVADSHNIRKFTELLSVDGVLPHVSDDDTSTYWLLSCFWLLNKIGRFKKMSYEMATKLEKIFIERETYALAIACKCYVSHWLRLLPGKTNVFISRVKIDEADKLAELENALIGPFCQGFLAFTKARFNQHVSNLVKFSNWNQVFSWERNQNLFDESLYFYKKWSANVPGNLEQTVFLNMYKSEQIRVILHQYRDLLPNIQSELEKDKQFQILIVCINMLHQAIENREEVAFAEEKTDDQVKLNNPMDYYCRAFKIYQLFGPEIEIQQVIQLKEWAECLPSEKAREKLQLAKLILQENFLQEHAWYKEIEDRLENLPDDFR